MDVITIAIHSNYMQYYAYQLRPQVGPQHRLELVLMPCRLKKIPGQYGWLHQTANVPRPVGPLPPGAGTLPHPTAAIPDQKDRPKGAPRSTKIYRSRQRRAAKVDNLVEKTVNSSNRRKYLSTRIRKQRIWGKNWGHLTMMGPGG